MALTRKEAVAKAMAAMLSRSFDWPDGCVILCGSAGNVQGHRKVRVGSGKVEWAHRVALEHYQGEPLAEGVIVRHKCDYPPCIARDHLITGTSSTNNSDTHQRNRQPNHVYENLRQFRRTG